MSTYSHRRGLSRLSIFVALILGVVFISAAQANVSSLEASGFVNELNPQFVLETSKSKWLPNADQPLNASFSSSNEVLGTITTVNSQATSVDWTTNVAVGKTATQSSTPTVGAEAWRAVDGSSDNVWGVGTIALTQNENQAWWEVDLEGFYEIDSIRILRRNVANTFGDFTVTLFDKTGTNIWDYDQVGPMSESLDITVPQIQAQTIRLQVNGTAQISLAEFEVFGREISMTPTYNVAVGKVATQPSTSSGGVASRAVDGNMNGSWSHQLSIAAPGNDGSNPGWWEVDLAGTYTVERIRLWDRTDSCCSDKLGDFTVILSDGTNTWEYVYSDLVGTYLDINVPYQQAQTVRIQNNNLGSMVLAEVEIFALESTVQPPSTSLAVGKSAEQSSTATDGEAWRAVDGSPDNTAGLGTLAVTQTENQPWWEVDLEGLYEIDSIHVLREDTALTFGDFTVTLYDENGITVETYAQVGQMTDEELIIPVGQKQAQTIRLQVNGVGQISLAEFEVFGRELSTSPTSNVALGKDAAQSATDLGGVASRAVDGTINGELSSQESVAVPIPSGSDPAWWEVDLLNNYTVERIRIWDRTDNCCTDGLGDFTVILSNGINTWQYIYTGLVDSYVDIRVPYQEATTVRVEKNGVGGMNLAEVQVFALDNPFPAPAPSITVGKPATQSSSVVGAEAWRAVDGSPYNASGVGTIAQTQSENNAWWEVDLEGVYEIDSLHILGDRDINSFGDFTVVLLDETEANIWQYVQTGGMDESLEISVPQIQAQKIRLQTNGVGQIQLAELEAFGREMSKTPTYNVAVGKNTTQLVTNAGGVASRAIDGNINGAWSEQLSIADLVDDGSNSGWWEVDLEHAYVVERIRIWDRTDGCCTDNLGDFTVTLSNGSNTWEYVYTGLVDTYVDIMVPYEQAMTVRIEKNGLGAMNLAEVQVFVLDDTVFPTPTLPSVAVGKTATQSSTITGGEAWRAIDGSSDNANGLGTIAFTYNENQPWWEVDLEGLYEIDSIRVLRRDIAGTFGDFTLMFFDEAGTSVWQYVQAGPMNESLDMIVPQIQAQTIRLQVNGTAQISLAEFEVFGREISPTPTYNVAVGKVATQASTSSGGVASRAIDGNMNGVWSGQSSIASAGNDGSNPGWWEVDLAGTYIVERIRLWDRTDSCCTDRLGDFTVILSDGTNTWEYVYSDLVGTYLDIDVPYQQAQTVRIQKNQLGGLNLAEVQVFALESTVQPPSTSLAVGKSTGQSSTATGGESWRAVDGSPDNADGLGTLAVTQTENQPWWEVDLEGLYEIDSIHVLRHDTALAFGDFTITLYDRDGITVETYDQVGQMTDEELIIPVGQKQAQTIRLQVNGVGQISLAEFEVFGRELSTSPTSNVALGKDAAQSATDLGGVASRAVDGTINGELSSQESIAVSIPAGSDPAWWEVDLANNYTVERIRIWDRTDNCCTDGLGDFTVILSNGINTWQYIYTGLVDTYVDIRVPYQEATTVRVEKNGAGGMNLAEVQVFALDNLAPVPLPSITVGKPANQSSSVVGAEAWRAVDGSPYNVSGVGTIAQTQSEDGAWWEVDIEGIYEIDSLHILRDRDINSFGDFTVMLLDETGANIWQYVQTGAMDESLEISVPQIQAQKIRLQTNGVGQIHLAELEAFGREISKTPTYNIAVGKNATQLVTNSGGVASRAIDGNINGAWSEQLSIADLGDDGSNSGWWEVDLADSYIVERIRIWDRTDGCCTDNLGDFTVILSNGANTWEYVHTGLVDTYVDIMVPYEQAMTVRIEKNGLGTMNLAEVQVFVLEDTIYPTPTRPSIAVGKDATQSSTLTGGEAWRAVDGSSDNANGLGTIAVTGHSENQPWWEVDLEGLYEIDAVRILRRNDMQNHFSDYTVTFLDGSGSTVWQYVQIGPMDESLEIIVPQIQAEKIRLQMQGTGQIRLAEFEVFGREISTTPTYNVAVGKAATQPSTSSGGVANRAVDGNINGTWSHQLSIASPGNDGTNPGWWEVDLAGTYTVERIRLWDRTDSCCTNRFGDFTVILSDGTNTWEYVYSDLVGTYLDIDVPYQQAQTIRIQKNQLGGLNIAEVQVFVLEDEIPVVMGWQPLNISAAPPVWGEYAMAYDDSSQTTLLYGGNATGWPYQNGTWRFNGTDWESLTAVGSPNAVYGANMAVLTGTTVLFGGSTSADEALNETWVFNGFAWTQQTPILAPSARKGAAAADDQTNQFWVFGGQQNTTYLNDLWVYDLVNNTWTEITTTNAPPSRSYATLAYDGSYLWLFGGRNSVGNDLSELWQLDLSTFNWTQVATTTPWPEGRIASALAYDPTQSQLVLFAGGRNTLDVWHNDTWLYEPATSSWVDVTGTTPLPPASAYHQAIYDAGSAAILIFTDGQTWTYK